MLPTKSKPKPHHHHSNSTGKHGRYEAFSLDGGATFGPMTMGTLGPSLCERTMLAKMKAGWKNA
jgi:hypothetical protein